MVYEGAYKGKTRHWKGGCSKRRIIFNFHLFFFIVIICSEKKRTSQFIIWVTRLPLINKTWDMWLIILIWRNTLRDPFPLQPLYSATLCRSTWTAPQCPFLKTNLKVSFLKKYFYNFTILLLLLSAWTLRMLVLYKLSLSLLFIIVMFNALGRCWRRNTRVRRPMHSCILRWEE